MPKGKQPTIVNLNSHSHESHVRGKITAARPRVWRCLQKNEDRGMVENDSRGSSNWMTKRRSSLNAPRHKRPSTASDWFRQSRLVLRSSLPAFHLTVTRSRYFGSSNISDISQWRGVHGADMLLSTRARRHGKGGFHFRIATLRPNSMTARRAFGPGMPKTTESRSRLALPRHVAACQKVVPQQATHPSNTLGPHSVCPILR